MTCAQYLQWPQGLLLCLPCNCLKPFSSRIVQSLAGLVQQLLQVWTRVLGHTDPEGIADHDRIAEGC